MSGTAAPVVSVSPATQAGGSTSAPVQTSAGADAKVSTPATSAPKVDAANEAPKVPEPPRRFKAKAKFDGKEQELDLDETDVVREIQKARHYDKTRPQFEQRVKDFEATLQQLQENPLAFLAERGVDLKGLAAQDLARESELAKLSPEARRVAELEQQIEQFKSAETKRAEAEQQAIQHREHQELVQNTVRTIDSAIKLSGLKRSGELVKLYAEVMELAEHAGEPPMSAEQLVAAGEKLESKRFAANIKRAVADAAWRTRNAPLMKELAQVILPALDGQELIDFVGRDNAVKLARAQLAVYRKNPIPTVAETPSDEKPPAAPVKTAESTQSMHAILDQLVGR